MATPLPQSKGALGNALRIRHLIFLAVGGTIASGFYLASGAAISLAGPAALIPYVFLAGRVTTGVVARLAELSVQGYSAAGFAKDGAIIAPIFQKTPGLFGISGGALPVVAGAVWVAIWTVYYMTIAKRLRAKQLLEHPHAEDMPAIVTTTT